ncbi:MAG: class I SAM-dependent methyltransferase [Myxococcota bacterium]
MDRNQSIQQQFGAAADRYRVSRYHQDAPDLDAMLGAVVLRGDERVLDVGTGTGHTALAFAPRVREVVGLDLTPAMLDQARSLAAERGVANVRFECGEAEALPYPDASFDLVTCRVCAHHFRRVGDAVREAARVLRPGGCVLWVDSISPEDPAADTFLNCIELLRDPSHVRNYTISQWRALFAEAGLAAEHRATWPVPLDFEDWTERMITPELARDQLRALFDDATEAIREVFALRADPYGFDIPISLLRAAIPGGRRAQ